MNNQISAVSYVLRRTRAAPEGGLAMLSGAQARTRRAKRSASMVEAVSPGSPVPCHALPCGWLSLPFMRDRRIDAVVGAEGKGGVAPVDRARAGVDQVPETCRPPAPLQDRDVPDQVGVRVVEGVVDRMPHPGLRREVDHAVDIAVALERRGQVLGIGDVGAREDEVRVRAPDRNTCRATAGSNPETEKAPAIASDGG